jgi:hypothetical protein
MLILDGRFCDSSFLLCSRCRNLAMHCWLKCKYGLVIWLVVYNICIELPFWPEMCERQKHCVCNKVCRRVSVFGAKMVSPMAGSSAYLHPRSCCQRLGCTVWLMERVNWIDAIANSDYLRNTITTFNFWQTPQQFSIPFIDAIMPT